MTSDRKITFKTKNNVDICIFLDRRNARELMDQVYDVFDGEYDDNCIEVIGGIENPLEDKKTTLLIKADEIVSVQEERI